MNGAHVVSLSLTLPSAALEDASATNQHQLWLTLSVVMESERGLKFVTVEVQRCGICADKMQLSGKSDTRIIFSL